MGKHEKSLTLNVVVDEQGKVTVPGHTSEESEKIIKSFLDEAKAETKTLSQPEKSNTIIISDNKKEVVYDAKNWNNQKFILKKNGTLKLKNDIDPEITIEADSLLIYDGYTVGLSDQQYNNINKAQKQDTMISFNDCYFNDDIVLHQIEVGIEGGAFGRVVFMDPELIDEVTESRTVMHIVNGANIDDLTIGRLNHVNVNCGELSDEDDALVEIEHLVVRGSASLYNCHVDHLSVRTEASVELACDVDYLHVKGIAYITEACSVKKIHIYVGGKICVSNFSSFEDIDITCDRSFRIREDKTGRTWIIG